MIQFHWKKFSELSVNELYALLKLRSEIFVVEQNCVYLDLDGKDFDVHHLLGMDNHELVAYLRVFPPSDIENYVVFGRVVTARSARAKGYGKQLMQELLSYCEKHFPSTTIKCSAQHYLLKFYESFGLKAYGDVYMEDAIPHIAMEKFPLIT